MITEHQAKYFAYELTKRCPADTPERLSATLANSRVDLNPHQIEAALFAMKSPLSKGVILADEVGLGKTIEAGILISQSWAERKKRILIICPSSLRKQWSQELLEKFYLSSIVMDAQVLKELQGKKKGNPFFQEQIIICSYHFAKNREDQLKAIPWDMVVMDEAHKLRNVYRTDNKIGTALKAALSESKKILLTATPLQNTLLELYGLVSIIDDHVFADVKSFKGRFSRSDSNEDNFAELKSRLKPVCHRNLRRDVQEYINYKNRIPITIEFEPTQEEQYLYDLVSDYLQRDDIYALPKSQRHLMTLIIRKLMASSTYAIAQTFDRLAGKLRLRLEQQKADQDIEDVADDFSAWGEIQEESDELQPSADDTLPVDIRLLKAEIDELETFRDLAREIKKNAKGEKLRTALEQGFSKARELGAQEKALIFTESTRTQEYLFNLFQQIPEYGDRVVLFNGNNNSEQARRIYEQWIQKHQGTDVISGSRSADTRAAIVDCFRDQAKIMIATEAGAEGINLQFCSLVINYDLPWNPQRIEQRIGRCHRYGQEFDVVVVNFVNQANAADQRVFQLLKDKFQLFSGVFGASDDILGAIESGVDFERRIAEIYQTCRTRTEINAAFDRLQEELEESIDSRISNIRQKLFDHFDQEVVEKMRLTRKNSEEFRDIYDRRLWETTRFVLNESAEFEPDQYAFVINNNPFPENGFPLGRYRLSKTAEDAHIYRIGHPLARQVIHAARNLPAEPVRCIFHYSGSGQKVSILESIIGQSGILCVYQLTVSALEDIDYVLMAGFTSDGEPLDEDQCRRMLALPCDLPGNLSVEIDEERLLIKIRQARKKIVEAISKENARIMEDEIEKLDHWAEDQRCSLQLSLKETEDEIKDLKRQSRLAQNLPDKLAAQKKARALEKRREELWRAYEQESRSVEQRKDQILDETENRLRQKERLEKIFTIEWVLQ